METIADYFRPRQDFFRRIDETFVKIGADFFDCRAQVLPDRFQGGGDRFFLAVFERGRGVALCQRRRRIEWPRVDLMSHLISRSVI
jgi:hypothetical protein